MSFKLSAEVNRYMKRIGIYETLEEAQAEKAKLLAKNSFCKAKIVQV
jgi:hypothetical protein